ncbi:hypothetical protein PPS11_24748 [Pseudomonas putida S11]|nr:hypothetical protein PPS11_24748 [Pseudomonas putida S11]
MAVGAQGQLLEVGVFTGAGGRFQAVQAANFKLAVVVGLSAAGEAATDVGEQFVVGVLGEVGGFLQDAGCGDVADHESAVFAARLEQQLTTAGTQLALHARSADGSGRVGASAMSVAGRRTRGSEGSEQRGWG